MYYYPAGMGIDGNVCIHLYLSIKESGLDHGRQLHDIHVLLWTSNIHVFVSGPPSLFLLREPRVKQRF